MNDALPDQDFLAELPDPQEIFRRLAALEGQAQARHRDFLEARDTARRHAAFLELAPRAEGLLDTLAQNLFGAVLDEIEASLSQAIAEILGQDRRVKSVRDTKAGRLTIHLHVEQDGKTEDILRGQGGSVANILSVSLRLIALSQLDPARHRPFLVLDEQDCWLKPELVPRFMKLVAQIAERLGLQVLVISHHPLDLFAEQAERVYALAPSREDGVVVRLVKGEA